MVVYFISVLVHNNGGTYSWLVLQVLVLCYPIVHQTIKYVPTETTSYNFYGNIPRPDWDKLKEVLVCYIGCFYYRFLQLNLSPLRLNLSRLQLNSSVLQLN